MAESPAAKARPPSSSIPSLAQKMRAGLRPDSFRRASASVRSVLQACGRSEDSRLAMSVRDRRVAGSTFSVCGAVSSKCVAASRPPVSSVAVAESISSLQRGADGQPLSTTTSSAPPASGASLRAPGA